MLSNYPLLKLRSKVFRGLSDETRLSILQLLSREPKNVSEIVSQLGIPQPTVSSHLSCLKDCNLVTVQKKGRERIYRLSTHRIKVIIEEVDQILQHSYQEISSCINYKGGDFYSEPI